MRKLIRIYNEINTCDKESSAYVFERLATFPADIIIAFAFRITNNNPKGLYTYYTTTYYG